MTPAARIQAAIEILDLALGGQAAEAVLTNWARNNRFAGSSDRAAIRDLVYDALRRLRSYAVYGAGGRGLMIASCVAHGVDPASRFTGERHAPRALDASELALIALRPEAAGAAALDCPDWLEAPLCAALGADFAAVMRALQARAPVFLRVNSARVSVAEAAAALAAEGILTEGSPLTAQALRVVEGERKIGQSLAYTQGLVELQDAASQSVIEGIAADKPLRVLDYCAGGGGKSLALAARLGAMAQIEAHDIDAGRMRDLPVRAARAGAQIRVLPPLGAQGRYDLVLVDAPCSGSGTWRRTPEAKWRLTPARLAELCTLQAEILDKAAALTGAGGRLVYMTCSLLLAENSEQISAFLTRNPAWRCEVSRNLTPLDGGDGFFCATLIAPN